MKTKCDKCNQKAINDIVDLQQHLCDYHFRKEWEIKLTPFEFIKQQQDYIFNQITKKI